MVTRLASKYAQLSAEWRRVFSSSLFVFFPENNFSPGAFRKLFGPRRRRRRSLLFSSFLASQTNANKQTLRAREMSLTRAQQNKSRTEEENNSKSEEEFISGGNGIISGEKQIPTRERGCKIFFFATDGLVLVTGPRRLSL